MEKNEQVHLDRSIDLFSALALVSPKSKPKMMIAAIGTNLQSVVTICKAEP